MQENKLRDLFIISSQIRREREGLFQKFSKLRHPIPTITLKAFFFWLKKWKIHVHYWHLGQYKKYDEENKVMWLYRTASFYDLSPGISLWDQQSKMPLSSLEHIFKMWPSTQSYERKLNLWGTGLQNPDRQLHFTASSPISCSPLSRVTCSHGPRHCRTYANTLWKLLLDVHFVLRNPKWNLRSISKRAIN